MLQNTQKNRALCLFHNALFGSIFHKFSHLLAIVCAEEIYASGHGVHVNGGSGGRVARAEGLAHQVAQAEGGGGAAAEVQVVCGIICFQLGGCRGGNAYGFAGQVVERLLQKCYPFFVGADQGWVEKGAHHSGGVGAKIDHRGRTAEGVAGWPHCVERFAAGPNGYTVHVPVGGKNPGQGVAILI